MRVTIKTLDSRTTTFTVPDESSVKDFKEHIASDVNVPADRQRLIFKGKVLNDERKLSECGVDGCVVHLVERKPPTQDNQGGNSSRSTSGSANSGTAANMTTEALQLPLDVMGVSQQIIQSLVSQLGADSAHANISTSASDDGSSVNVHINLQTTSQPGTLVNQRIHRARRFLRDASQSLNRMEGEGIMPSSQSMDDGRPASDGHASPMQAGGSQDSGMEHASNSPLTLAQVFRETSEFTSNLQTAIERYISILEANSAENLAPSDDTLPDRIAETLHNLSHAYHALSDLSFNFRAPEPRTVSLLSPLSPHGVPNVPLISSLLGGVQQPQFAGLRPTPQPEQTAAQSGGASAQAHPLRSNQNVRIRVDPQGGVAITSIIAAMGRPGAPTQNAQATQGVQTTTTTSGTRHGGNNSNGSRETFSRSFGNQRSSVSSNGAGTAANTSESNPQQPAGTLTTRIVVDDFIALVSGIAPESLLAPSAGSSTSVPASAGQAPGLGQPGAGGPRFHVVNPMHPTAASNHPDPSVPCQSFHFGPQAPTGSSQSSGQQEARRQPTSETSRQAAAHEGSSAASSRAQPQQPTADAAVGSREGSALSALFGLFPGFQGSGNSPFGSSFLQQAFHFNQGSGATRHAHQQQQPDGGNTGAQDPAARQQRSQTISDLVRGLQESGVDVEEGDGGLVYCLIDRLSNVLTIQDIMGISFGSSDPYRSMRPTLVEFVNTDLLHGAEPNSENLKKANEELVNEIVDSISGFLTSVPAKEGVDIVASVRSFFQLYLNNALRLIVNSDDDSSFAQQFQELMKDLSAEFFTLLSMCYQDGLDGVENIIRNRIPEYSFTRDLDPGMREIIVQMFARHIRQAHLTRMHCQQRLQVHVIKVQETKAPERTPVRPPVSAAPLARQDMDMDTCSEDSDSFGTPPVSIHQDEPAEADIEEEDVEWTTIMPQDWVPVIARDIVKQRRHPPQAPFSDAYLSGMPAKKRRKVDQRGIAPTVDVIPAALRQAVAAAGVTPRTSMEELNRAVQGNSDLHRAYRREVHREVKTKLEKDTDYNPDRFPNTRDYFDKDYSEK